MFSHIAVWYEYCTDFRSYPYLLYIDHTWEFSFPWHGHAYLCLPQTSVAATTGGGPGRLGIRVVLGGSMPKSWLCAPGKGTLASSWRRREDPPPIVVGRKDSIDLNWCMSWFVRHKCIGNYQSYTDSLENTVIYNYSCVLVQFVLNLSHIPPLKVDSTNW